MIANTEQIKAEMQAKLKQLPIPSYEIKVFGVLGLNIHIIVEGPASRDRWVAVLSSICSKVVVADHMIYNKQNMGTNLQPSRRSGYLVAGVV